MRFFSNVYYSDYDSPGTVELVLNRRTYRVGQSWVSGTDETFIYTISMIQPIPRKAKCHKYMRMNKTFVCPEGEEDSYVLLSADVVLDLTLLKVPCKVAFRKFSMRYEQEDENQRSFAYYNETGKILHHPTKPAVCECNCRISSCVYSGLFTSNMFFSCSGTFRRSRWDVTRSRKVLQCEMGCRQ